MERLILTPFGERNPVLEVVCLSFLMAEVCMHATVLILACSKAFMSGCFLDEDYARVDSKVWLLFRPGTEFFKFKTFQSHKEVLKTTVWGLCIHVW